MRRVKSFSLLVLLGLLVPAPAWAQPQDEDVADEPTPDEEAPADPPADEPAPETDAPEEPPPPEEDSEPGQVATLEENASDTDVEVEGEAEVALPVTSSEPKKPKAEPKKEDEWHRGYFDFGSYGRVVAATDHQGRAPRQSNIVAFGSRFDIADNYVELELRREDSWLEFGAHTKIVATTAFTTPVFHYNGDFDARLAVRNLFIEERGLGHEGLSFWAGSRMYRGDDIYPLNWWPLDNVNTIGAGVGFDNPDSWTFVRAHFGIGQPNNPFFKQTVDRALPLNQFGAAQVAVLDRQRFIGTLRAEQHLRIGDNGGIKFIGYGEVHSVPSGQRETEVEDTFEDVPKETGYVVGAQVGGYTGERDTHINLFVRYARGLAAYGDFANPQGQGLDETVNGAREILVAAGGNLEVGIATFLLGAYFRSFRNASEALDFGDVDEGIILVRPNIFILDWLGVAVEGSYQAQQRGVLVPEDGSDGRTGDVQQQMAHVGRVGLMPFLSPGGRGSFRRPIIYAVYNASFRDAGAKALYPDDDVFGLRSVDHFIGVGAEWWFSSSSYGRGE